MKTIDINIVSLLHKTIINNNKLGKLYVRKHTNQKYTLTEILKEILYILRTGISWRNLKSHIKWQTLYWHFKRFIKYDIFKKAYLSIISSKIYYTNIHIIDSTFIVNKFGKNNIARNKFYKNKKGNKISAIIDSNGIPLSILIKPGNVHDISFINDHINDMINLPIKIKKYKKYDKYILADKGYESKNVRYVLSNENYIVYIPTKIHSKIIYPFNKILYKQRIKIEHFFARLKLFRRINVRYESKLINYYGFLFMALCYIILEKITN